MRCDADKGDIPKHLVKGPTGIIHRSRCSRMLSMFLRGAPRNALGICWKCSTSCYMYILYVYIIIYNICYRYQGKQVDRRNSNVLKDQGSQGSTDLFRPSYWAIDAEMLPTKQFNKHVNQNR